MYYIGQIVYISDICKCMLYFNTSSVSVVIAYILKKIFLIPFWKSVLLLPAK